MPRYRSKKKQLFLKNRQRIRKGISRDRRHLLRWAAQGSYDDYKRLNAHARRLIDSAPSYIDRAALEHFTTATRRSLVQSINEQDHDGSWITDSLGWLLDKVKSHTPWKWMSGLGQAVLKPFKGDSLSEEDEIYASLVDATYKDQRADQVGVWTRVPRFDSEYVSVWDNPDGHRYISVRGTKAHWQDAWQDVGIALSGHSNDLISSELETILDNTDSGRIVDAGAHSLGTSLLAEAYQANPGLQDRIRQTFLYNPAISPFNNSNVTQKYESDERVRYFINLNDFASVGSLGESGPKNVVYRTKWSLNPLAAHKITEWYQDLPPELATIASHHDKKEELDNVLPQQGLADAFGDGMLLDFGDSYDLDKALGF